MDKNKLGKALTVATIASITVDIASIVYTSWKTFKNASMKSNNASASQDKINEHISERLFEMESDLDNLRDSVLTLENKLESLKNEQNKIDEESKVDKEESKADDKKNTENDTAETIRRESVRRYESRTPHVFNYNGGFIGGMKCLYGCPNSKRIGKLNTLKHFG